VSIGHPNLFDESEVPASGVGVNGYAIDRKTSAHKTKVTARIGTKHISRLTRQLATLLRAGMPLVPALSALTEQLKSSQQHKKALSKPSELAVVIERIRDSVNEGSSFAEALKEHPSVFSSFFVNMVAAGEAGGTLEQALLRITEVLEKRVQLMGKVKSAIAYPVMMAIVAVAVVTFLLSYVVPSITQIFLEMNRTLPWPTTLLISTSAFIRSYLAVIALLCFAVIFGSAASYRIKQARYFVDYNLLKLPLFGQLALKLEISRFTRTLGMLLDSGVPILAALEMTKAVVRNSYMAKILSSLRDRVSKGQPLDSAIRETGLFPPVVSHIVATGQVSGNVEEGLSSIADMYDNEVEIATKTLTSLLEPAILLIMGVIVGFIVMAILLPIFEINQAL
jgi:general secretion pathway protein F